MTLTYINVSTSNYVLFRVLISKAFLTPLLEEWRIRQTIVNINHSIFTPPPHHSLFPSPNYTPFQTLYHLKIIYAFRKLVCLRYKYMPTILRDYITQNFGDKFATVSGYLIV